MEHLGWNFWFPGDSKWSFYPQSLEVTEPFKGSRFHRPKKVTSRIARFRIFHKAVFVFVMHLWSWGVISPSWIPTAAVRMPVKLIEKSGKLWFFEGLVGFSNKLQMYVYPSYLLMYLGIFSSGNLNKSKVCVYLFVDAPVCLVFLLKSFLVSPNNVFLVACQIVWRFLNLDPDIKAVSVSET